MAKVYDSVHSAYEIAAVEFPAGAIQPNYSQHAAPTAPLLLLGMGHEVPQYDPYSGIPATYWNEHENAWTLLVNGARYLADFKAGPPQWAQLQNDAQHTGQTSASGPTVPGLKWNLPMSGGFMGGTAIGADGAIYVGDGVGNANAISAQGVVLHTHPGAGGYSVAPAIGPDGTVYFSGTRGTMAFWPNLQPKWQSAIGSCGGSISVGPDGTIYVSNDLVNSSDVALDPVDGHTKWTFPPWSCGVPAISADGNTLYMTRINALYTLNLDGSVRTTSPVPNWGCGLPVVGPDGTVYVPSLSAIWRFDSNGSPRNQILLPASKIVMGLALNSQTGTLIATVFDFTPPPPLEMENFTGGQVWAINASNGSTLWSRPIEGGTYHRDGTPYSFSLPLIDGRGFVYLSTLVGTVEAPAGTHLYAFDPNGVPVFDYYVSGNGWSDPRLLSLDASGTLYQIAGGGLNAFANEGAPAARVDAGAGPNGTISPVGNLSLPSGSSATFTLTPAAGFRVAGVQVDGQSVGPVASYTFQGLSGYHSIRATFEYDTITLPAEPPLFSPPGGTYSAAQLVKITSPTPGASIRYTTDGSLPTLQRGMVLANGGTVSVERTLTIKAVAWITNGIDSSIATGTYILKVAPLTLTPAAGTYFAAQKVTIASSTQDALIHFTTDGTMPSATVGTELANGGTVSVDRSLTLRAIGYKPGWSPTATVSATYTLRVAGLTLTPGSGRYSTPQTVTIASATEGALIHYTTDGTWPTAAVGTELANGGAVIVDRSLVLKAIAYKPGWTATAVMNAFYTLKVEPLTLSPGSTTSFVPQMVKVSTPTANALIHFTTDGTMPSATVGTELANGGTVSVDRSLTLRAIGYKSGWSPTAAVSATYTLRVAGLTLTPAPGRYSAAQTVTIATPTEGARIRYTTDGTWPSATIGTELTNGGSVLVDRSLPLKAIGYKEGWTSSPVFSGYYTF